MYWAGFVLLSVFLEADLVSHWPQRRVGGALQPLAGGTQPGQPPRGGVSFPTADRVGAHSLGPSLRGRWGLRRSVLGPTSALA